MRFLLYETEDVRETCFSPVLSFFFVCVPTRGLFLSLFHPFGLSIKEHKAETRRGGGGAYGVGGGGWGVL